MQPHKLWPVLRCCNRCDCSDLPCQLFYSSVTSFVSETFRGTLTFLSNYIHISRCRNWYNLWMTHINQAHAHTFFCSIFYRFSDFLCKSISWKPGCLPSTGSEALLNYQQCHLNSAVLLNYWKASFKLRIVSLCFSSSASLASIRPRYPLCHLNPEIVQCLQTLSKSLG